MEKGALGENISILQERENAIFIWRGTGEGGIWFRNKIYRPFVKVQYRNEKRRYCSLIFLILFLPLIELFSDPVLEKKMVLFFRVFSEIFEYLRCSALRISSKSDITICTLT